MFDASHSLLDTGAPGFRGEVQRPLSKSDFDTLAKLGEHGLEGRSISEALSWREWSAP
jgi:hypothetical protein